MTYASGALQSFRRGQDVHIAQRMAYACPAASGEVIDRNGRTFAPCATSLAARRCMYREQSATSFFSVRTERSATRNAVAASFTWNMLFPSTREVERAFTYVVQSAKCLNVVTYLRPECGGTAIPIVAVRETDSPGAGKHSVTATLLRPRVADSHSSGSPPPSALTTRAAEPHRLAARTPSTSREGSDCVARRSSDQLVARDLVCLSQRGSDQPRRRRNAFLKTPTPNLHLVRPSKARRP